MCNVGCEPAECRRTVAGMRRIAPLLLLVAVVVVLVARGRDNGSHTSFGRARCCA
jgi:hypothetical protein